ncbi:GTP pyrophosphokinase [Bradyrhizobium phage BDU-MI-1]|nr:GTP pyrophosphokinase [Bradyrhizobium phage BDU-MI-1]
MGLIRSAEDFARRAHGDQKRKWTGDPYWHHLQEVARTLLSYGATPDVVAAGWLHDTIEDTTTSYQELVQVFGPVIAGLVIEVTDVSRRDSGNTPEGIGNRVLRKAIDRQYLAGASWRGQMIKCADMLSNTKDIVAHGGNFANVYVPEKKLLIQVLDKVRQTNYSIWRDAFDQIVKAEQAINAAA